MKGIKIIIICGLLLLANKAKSQGCLINFDIYPTANGTAMNGTATVPNYTGTPIPTTNGGATTGCRAVLITQLGACKVNSTTLGQEWTYGVIDCAFDNSIALALLGIGLLGFFKKSSLLN